MKGCLFRVGAGCTRRTGWMDGRMVGGTDDGIRERLECTEWMAQMEGVCG